MPLYNKACQSQGTSKSVMLSKLYVLSFHCYWAFVLTTFHMPSVKIKAQNWFISKTVLSSTVTRPISKSANYTTIVLLANVGIGLCSSYKSNYRNLKTSLDLILM